jgi:uncharacterized protein (DUF924 family)
MATVDRGPAVPTIGTAPPWQPVLDFWFLPDDDPLYGSDRPAWFRKDPKFDASIAERFLPWIERAIGGAFVEWDVDIKGALARIVVLDQFTRNVFRGTARAFAGDPLALQCANALVDAGHDKTLNRVERSFVYLPFEHAEDLAMQDKCVALYEQLGREHDRPDTAAWAIKHRDIIARFGRFPHRNRMLDRESTQEEIEFLKAPGSSF